MSTLQPTFDQILGFVTRQYKEAPKLKPVDYDGDVAVVDRVRHTMKKGEKLLQWYARVGLGRPQIMTMSREQITAFVAQAERNRLEECLPPPELWEPKRIAPKFFITITD